MLAKNARDAIKECGTKGKIRLPQNGATASERRGNISSRGVSKAGWFRIKTGSLNSGE